MMLRRNFLKFLSVFPFMPKVGVEETVEPLPIRFWFKLEDGNWDYAKMSEMVPGDIICYWEDGEYSGQFEVTGYPYPCDRGCLMINAREM